MKKSLRSNLVNAILIGVLVDLKVDFRNKMTLMSNSCYSILILISVKRNILNKFSLKMIAVIIKKILGQVHQINNKQRRNLLT